ncbi:hypothetical protein BGW80DRAFT_1293421, partial [Lactifluus volemus]
MTPPPPSDDEPKYLTIVRPYPLDADRRALDADWRALALWLACCIGKKDVLTAMFQNPTVGFYDNVFLIGNSSGN